MKSGLVWLALVASCSTATACGSVSSTGSEVTLESWRERACNVLTQAGEAVERSAPAEEDPSELFSTEAERRQVEAMRQAVAELQAIPLPDERRADAERFVEVFDASSRRYEEALPRIEAASRRLAAVMKSIDAEDLPPPPEEPTTVAGGIMSQLMSTPEFEQAFADLMRAYESAAAGIDEEEAEAVSKRLGLSECMKPEEQRKPGLSAAELARCGARGSPVTVQKLVDVFRAHGISLEIEEETCGKPERDQVAGFDSDATNRDDRELEEGFVLCDVADAGFAERLEVTKYDTDTETRMQAANVGCTIYPHSPETEAKQVARLRRAMEAVAARAR